MLRRNAVPPMPTPAEAISEKNDVNEGVDDIMEPAIFVLRVFGLAHATTKRGQECGIRPRCSVSKVYSLVIICLLWCNPIRYFMNYKAADFTSFQPSLMLKIPSHLWTLNNAIAAVVMFKMFNDADKMPTFVALYNDFQHNYDCPSKRKTQRRSIIMIVVFIMLLVTMGFISYVVGMFAGIHDFFNVYLNSLAPFQHTTWIRTNVPMKLVFIVNYIFSAGAWLLPIMFFFVTCYLLLTAENQFTKKITACLRSDGSLSGSVLQLRVHFLKICELIDVANNMFRVIIGCGMVLFILSVCMQIYVLLNSDILVARPIAGFYTIYWTILQVFILLLLSYGAGLINDRAYGCLPVLHRVLSMDDSKDNEFHMNMLLSKLNGPSIGFSAFDLFAIDKPSILTVFGMILTYLLLLIEMGGDSSSSSPCSIADADVTTSFANLTNVSVP